MYIKQNKITKQYKKQNLNLSKLFIFTKSLLKPDNTHHQLSAYHAIQNTSRYKKYSAKNKTIQPQALLTLIKQNEENIKLNTMINYGERTILPEIIKIYNNDTSQLMEPIKQQFKYKKFKTEPRNNESKSYELKDILLKECEKDGSYLKYKQHKIAKKSIRSSIQKSNRKLDDYPIQLKKLSNKRKSIKPKPSIQSNNSFLNYHHKRMKIQDILIETKELMNQQNLRYKFKKESRNQEADFQIINKNYKELVKNEFPPIQISRVIKHLNQSEEMLQKQIELDLLNQQKKQVYKKFNRIMKNEHLKFQMHLKHFEEFKLEKKKDYENI